MSQFPITVTENLNLQKLGVNQKSIGFSTLAIESDKYLCVSDKTSESPELLIIDIKNPSNIVKYPVKSDSARINPKNMWIGLKAGKNIQVFDAEQKKRIKSYVLPEEVVFWKWISSDLIALVTDRAVYHWRVDDESESPSKIFDRTESQGAQIINYKCDEKYEWCALVSISSSQNKIIGNVQLYSTEQKVSQSIEAHACTFLSLKIDDNTQPSKLFAFALRSSTAALYINEIGVQPGNKPFSPRKIEIYFPADAVGDFPVSIHFDKAGLIYLVTKLGFLHLFEIESSTCIFVNRISQDVVFASADCLTSGFIFVNRIGGVNTITINENIVNYCISKNLESAAFYIAARTGFSGAEPILVARFNELFNKGMFAEAARLAAKTQGTVIRNAQTIARFQQQSPSAPGQTQPIFNYFSSLLESGKLNALESVELCKFVFNQNKKQLVEKWLREDKLECTQELGDLAKNFDKNLALSIYLRANCSHKVVQCFAETGQFDKIVIYSQKVNYIPDYSMILRSMIHNPETALQFAKSLLVQDVDIESLSNVLLEIDSKQYVISFLAEALKSDKPEQAALQTKLLEISLKFNPQVAEAIFAKKILTHFDKSRISHLCEGVGHIQRALEFYTDIFDIKRAIVQTHLMNPNFVINYFGTLSVDDCLACLKILLEYNLRQNLQIVVQVAIKYHEQLGVNVLIGIFESVKSIEALFMFLNEIINKNQDPEVHFKYIVAAAKTNQIKEVERICKESNFYDPEKVKNFLKDFKLNDQIPLIIVCDRFDFVNDLVTHLHKNNLLRFIEIYVQKVNPLRLPEIIGSLIDLDVKDDYLKQIMQGTPPSYSMAKLVEETSRRNRIKLVRPIVESLIQSGTVDSSVHSALAIILIESNNKPEVFLRDNIYYDTLYVGNYCEHRDPNLACICYEKGSNVEELINICVKNGLYKNLSRFAIVKKDGELWARLLSPENDYRRSLIDQTSQSILAETFEPECISEMVKALMSANLPKDLIDLLEKIVLADSAYRHHKNLQNLLLLTAIKTDSSRIIDFVERLDNYDGVDIANVAINYKLYEEALSIYKKFELHNQAISVLADHIKNLDRAFEYAERINMASAWSILANAQLINNQPKEAIESYMRANDSSAYINVINYCSNANVHESLLKYLIMVKREVKDSIVDTEYAFCLGYTDRFELLGEFLKGSQNTNSNAVGERFYDLEKYYAAKIIFKYSNNFPMLALTHVKCKEYQFAIDMARKASSVKMWKTICHSCLSDQEFKFAQICALNLVIHPEELPEIVSSYEDIGRYNELIELLEASTNLERSHMGIFTELACLYAKYTPKKLQDHLDVYWTRINIPKVIKAVTTHHLWSSLVFLHDKYEEYDQAILVIISHPVTFNDIAFRDIIQKVNNQEILYKAIYFYYDYKPMFLNDLLMAISTRVDHSKAINILKSLDILALCKNYLISVQKLNINVINEAINSIYIEEEAYDDLRTSIEKFSNYDTIKLANILENHESIEFRRICTLIRKLSNKWGMTVEMAKKDGLYGDAIIYAAESRDPDMAQSLLEYFIEIKQYDKILGLLYFCYDIVRPDQVLEICWSNNLTHYCMPFMIQFMRDSSVKIHNLESKVKTVEKIEDSARETMFVNTNPSGQLMIGGGAGFAPSFGSGSGMYGTQSNFNPMGGGR